MITTVEALPEKEFAEWLEHSKGGEGHGGHEALEKHGCLGCHSEDGSPKIGPTFKGIWGRNVTVLSGGAERAIVADEPYLRRSILEPGADLVKGFPPIMPPFTLKEDELKPIMEYLKGLK
jgi:cytochrome c oxidase subunit 2